MEQEIAKKNKIASLQKEILSMQHMTMEEEHNRVALGGLEKAFPNNSFPTAGIHEFISQKREHIAATNGFLTGLLATLSPSQGHYLWIGANPQLYAPGMAQFGIQPEHIIFVRSLKDKETLWVMEEALQCSSLFAVIGELSQLSFKSSRRLQLAIEESKVMGFIHRQFPQQTEITACLSRWQIESSSSILRQKRLPGIGSSAWKVQLLKVRNGKPRNWTVAWNAGQFNIVKPEIGLANPTKPSIQYYG